MKVACITSPLAAIIAGAVSSENSGVAKVAARIKHLYQPA
jgi:hypothetical protein